MVQRRAPVTGTIVLCAFLALLATPAPAAGQGSGLPDWAAPPVYDWPVPGQPVAGFRPPEHPWAAGHRGVDLAVRAGQPVHPMADGMVVWSGTIAGDSWTTLSHGDGVVTTYGPLQAPSGAALGTPVTSADVIGRARGDAHGRKGRLHVGARREGRYIDPAVLVADGPQLVATLVGPGRVGADDPTAPTGRPTLVPGTPPSPNHLIVLAGLTSHTGELPFDVSALGYGDGTWDQYSYRGVDADGNPLPYDHEATWGRVHDMASALRDQLRAHAEAHPGQAVDLLGHSLGGLVAMYYLLVLHDPADPTLPPIGRAITVASPLRGTDSARVVDLLRDDLVGQVLLALVEAHRLTPPGGDGPVMHAQMPVLDDLQVGSDVAEAVATAWQRHLDDPYAGPLATGTDVLTVGTTLDPVVNEHRSGLPGTDHQTIFDPDVVDAHSNVTHAPRTEELLEAHLAGEPLPDGGLGQDVANATAGIGSSVVAAVEYAIAAGILSL